MAVDSSLVDRIVRGILDGLVHPSPAPAPAAGEPSRVVRLDALVITADVLAQHVPAGASAIVVSPKAILTPAALDVARSRRLQIQRSSSPARHADREPRRLALVVRATPVLDRLLAESGDWRRELLGCPDEAARLASGSVCRGDADVIAIFASQHHRAACLANRNERVQAVAIGSLDGIPQAAGQLRVNVFCVDPTGRPEFEMKRWLDRLGTAARRS